MAVGGCPVPLLAIESNPTSVELKVSTSSALAGSGLGAQSPYDRIRVGTPLNRPTDAQKSHKPTIDLVYDSWGRRVNRAMLERLSVTLPDSLFSR